MLVAHRAPATRISSAQRCVDFVAGSMLHEHACCPAAVVSKAGADVCCLWGMHAAQCTCHPGTLPVPFPMAAAAYRHCRACKTKPQSVADWRAGSVTSRQAMLSCKNKALSDVLPIWKQLLC